MKELEKAVLAVMLGKKEEQVDEAKKPLHPNQQKLDVHEPEKDELTSKDFEMLRAGKKAKMKEEVKVLPDDQEEMDDEEDDDEEEKNKKKHMKEMSKSMAYATGTKKAMQMTGDKPPLEKATIKKGHEIAKAMLRKEDVELEEANTETKKEFQARQERLAASHAETQKNPDRLARMMKIPGYADAMKLAQKSVKKEEVESFDDYDELVESKPFEFSVEEFYTFGDYLITAKKLVGEEQAVELANNSYNSKSTDLFLEAFGRDDIEKKVKMHMNAGHQVSTPKYSTKGGEFHAEYVVTDKESGIRRKYIHHGSSRKVENMGAAGKRD